MIDINQAGIAEIIKDAGNAFCLLEDFFDDVIGEQGVSSAGDGEMMGDEGFGFVFIQTGEKIAKSGFRRQRLYGLKSGRFVNIGTAWWIRYSKLFKKRQSFKQRSKHSTSSDK